MHAVAVRAEPQHLDGLDAEERHARRRRARPSIPAPAKWARTQRDARSPGSSERSCVTYAAGGRNRQVGPGVARRRSCSLVVSNANSTVCPGRHLRLRGNPCHELVFAGAGLRGQLRQLRGLRARRPEVVKYTYLSAPSDSTRSTVTSKVSARMRSYASISAASSKCSGRTPTITLVGLWDAGRARRGPPGSA